MHALRRGALPAAVALYNLVIVQGLQDHYPEFLNRQHLIDAWPLLRRRLAEDYVEAWENRFVEMAGRGASREAFAEVFARWQAAAWV